MRISVFGTGYVGLVTGVCLADVGHEVICVDIDASKINRLQQGDIPIYEPGLATMVKRNIALKRLHFTTDATKAIEFATLQFIAVGTPPDEDGSADLQYVLQVANSIGTHMNNYKVIINKSTVPVGTGEKVTKIIEQKLADRQMSLRFDVCSNPEFLKEGAAISDFTGAARIIIGTNSPKVQKLMRECYAPYNRNHEKIIFMDRRSAELTKYAANAMLATKISFMNEMANLAEKLGVDAENIRRGIGSDPRIGYAFIYPGCGYGGSCFPKDIAALLRTAEEQGFEATMLNAVEKVNQIQKNILIQKVTQVLGTDLTDRIIAVWGLAFKPETDDMRDAPSRLLMEAVWEKGGKIQAFDPEAMEECHRIYAQRNDLALMSSRDEALINADVLVICTEWKEFRAVNFCEIKSKLKQPVIIDGRNLFEPSQVKAAGLTYLAIGRGDSLQSEDTKNNGDFAKIEKIEQEITVNY